MAMEVRDNLEIAHTSEYLNFLRHYFRAFSILLTQITTPQMTESVEQKVRNVVIEILNRLPHSEVLRPFVQDLLKLSLQVITQDNEDNALIAIRIIFDLLRNFRPTLEAEVQPFLDFVCTIYRKFPDTVAYFFDNTRGNSGGSVPNLSVSNGSAVGVGDDVGGGLDGGPVVSFNVGGNGQLNPSVRSFKIVTESPLVVMFLFQLYSKLVQTNIPILLPLMVTAISVPGPEKVPSHLKPHYVELKGAQVKVCRLLLVSACCRWMLIFIYIY